MKYIPLVAVLISATSLAQTGYQNVVFGNKSVATKLPEFVSVKHDKNDGIKGTYCKSDRCSIEMTRLDAGNAEAAKEVLNKLAKQAGVGVKPVGPNYIVQMPTGVDSENGVKYEFIHFTMAVGGNLVNITIKSPEKNDRTPEISSQINAVVNAAIPSLQSM